MQFVMTGCTLWPLILQLHIWVPSELCDECQAVILVTHWHWTYLF